MPTALLVIDVQQALCFGEYAAFEATRVIDRINLVSDRCRNLGAPVIFIQHETDYPPLQVGFAGWQLGSGLHVAPSDIRVRKRTPDSYLNTDLLSILTEHDISELIICGLQSEFCVDTTTRRSLALGFPVTLIADGHSTVDNTILTAAKISAHHNETLANIASFGPRVRVMPASEIVNAGSQASHLK
ncbi:MAG: cysteine hydrolase family protein [Sterolibacterium sp.]|jgi:nicotinamidase-related amidase